MVKIHSIDCGNIMVDGGAMFGLLPKQEWSKLYYSDENNMCNIKMRSMLVETAGRLVLIDTGIGNRDKLKNDYGFNGDGNLLLSLSQKGFSPEDITDVILTHMHIDHCGGTLTKGEDGKIIPTFPNADIWVSKKQWNSAMSPRGFERDSFMLEDIIAMEKTGKLNFIDEEGEFLTGIELYFASGHTLGQIIPFINYNGVEVMFAADLIPTSVNVRLNSISAYDVCSELSFDEKEKFLERVIENKGYVFFKHDIEIECCSLKKENGSIVIDRRFGIDDILK